MSRPALCARTSSAPSVGSPTTLPSTSLASLATRYGRIGVVDRRRGADGVLDRAFEAVADARDRVAVADVDDLDRGHLVHRQRAGLVGVDRRREPERLDRRQVLHDRVALREIDAAERQDHLGHGRERLGDRGDGERHRADEQRVPRGAAVAAQREHHDHREPGRAAIHRLNVLSSLRQRRLLLRGRRQHSGDLPELGVGAGRR